MRISRRMRSKYKNLISLFFALMVTLATATGLMAAVIINCFCNPDTVIKAVKDSTYYDDKIALASDKLAVRLEESGLPKSIAEDVVSERNMVVDLNYVVSSKINGDKEYKVDTRQFENNLTNCINKFYEENLISNNEELQTATQMFVKQATAEYESLIDFELADNFTRYSDKYTSICIIVICVCIGVVLISIIMMLIIHIRKYRGIRYINYGLISGTILAIIINVLLKSKLLKDINDNSDIFSEIIRGYIVEACSDGIYVCLFGMMISFVMIFITIYLRKEAI